MNSELRHNKISGQWVIYAPGRSERPSDFENDTLRTSRPKFDNECPFCPGNEDMLPTVISEYDTGVSNNWQTRVVPNKFPMLTPQQERERKQHGPYVQMAGYGHHEVIIEHPRHDIDLPQMTHEEVKTVIDTYHHRYTELMWEHKNMMGIIFRNHGKRAGTSILHPHSQLVVTGVVPKHIRWRERIAQDYYDKWGHALLSDLVQYEMQVGKRIVDTNEAFVAFVPYAAEVPFEMWIIPRRQQADFGAITETEKEYLAYSLQNCLQKLHQVLDNPDYNYIINTAARYKADEPHLSWYVQIRPRLITPAGFEIGSGMLVNPSLPEHDASRLRN